MFIPNIKLKLSLDKAMENDRDEMMEENTNSEIIQNFVNLDVFRETFSVEPRRGQ